MKDVGKSTPVVEVIRRVLENRSKPVTVEELTVHVSDSWGRDFPSNPYEDVALIYKLATRILGCKETFDEVGGERPVLSTGEGEDLPLGPNMTPEQLNQMVDQIRHVKLELP
jgi:hypothetical protein